MTALGTDFAQPAPGKTCGSCTLCCKVVGVAELKKPADVWCGHCNKAKGCKIYDTRPQECRTFYCLFLLGADFPELWRPSKSKLVLYGQGNDVVVHVDPGAPGAWLSEPFYTALKGLAENQGPLGGMVSARIGRRCIVFKPDGHIDLGALGDDETIRFSFHHGQVEATKIRHQDAPEQGHVAQRRWTTR
jgi:hypothetical protein